ncbi:CynX/NimT family MFS transporter [Bartonella sp. DGB2]|uniref:CynX/NimT family MFS transporter n=1 Tax=Bartonella sp. DGB2 TaxID=3388426 RepID=UPI0039900FBD
MKRQGLSSFVLGFSLTLIAFNLRPVFSSFSVLLPAISQDLGLSATQAGLLTTVPVLCLGCFAPLAPYFGQRFGVEKVLAGALALLAVGLLVRASGSLPWLYGGTIASGAAIALSNVLLPNLVKRDFPHHMGVMTSFYTMALCGGAALAMGLTAPLQAILGDSWHLALAFWALPVVAVLALWVPQLKSQHHTIRGHKYRVRGLWKDPLAWQVTFFMGMQSSLAYCVFGWLVPILRERGVDDSVSGMLISISIFIQAGSCMITPLLAGRRAQQSGLNFILCALAVGGLFGFLFAPLDTLWVWVVIQGLGQGGLIAAAMMMIVLRSRDAPTSAHLSGMAQTVGYCLAAFGPLLVGVVHDWTGSFAACGFVFLGFGSAAGIAGYLAGRPCLTNTTTLLLDA